jgi:CO/xanthine dehydrogenase Mo-binding subunit
VINPKIVRGMTMGGIGWALYEEFAYDAQNPAGRAKLDGLSAAVCA